MLGRTLESVEMTSNLDESIWSSHLILAEFNQSRLTPQLPNAQWREKLKTHSRMLLLEGEVLEWELNQVAEIATAAPRDARSFLSWFGELLNIGPGQNDPLFDWLADSADIKQMTWFIQQEVAGEAGFDDLTALTQIKLPLRPKLEIARNYWDEMGRGQAKGMHGPMLEKLAVELGIGEYSLNDIAPEALALGNVLLGLAINRRYVYHSIGALGAVELTAPSRAVKVYQGLSRLGISPEAQRYFRLHSTLDVKHSASWNAEVIAPLIEESPELAPAIAEGALMRLNAGARCFERYRRELWTNH